MQILNSIISALCLCIGFYFGFKIGKTNELPRIVKTKREKKEEKEEEKKISEIEKVLNNLNRYDGTSKGQEEIV